MINKKKNIAILLLVYFSLLFAITLFAGGCACKDRSIVGIRVMVEGNQVSEQNSVIRVQGKTNFDLTSAIEVFSIHTNGEEKQVMYKGDSDVGFEILGSLPTPLIAGAYDLTVKYLDYGSVKFKLVLEVGYNRIQNVSNISKTYDGLPVNDPTFDLDFEQEIKIEYFVNTGYSTQPISSPPTNAGNYLVKITAIANNFATQSVFTSAFAISKKTPFEITTHPSFNLDYLSTRTLADLKLNTGYSWLDPSETPTANKNKYSAMYNPDPTNYNSILTNITVNINKIKVSMPNPNLDFTYNGEKQFLNIAENPLYTISNNGRTNAGYQQVIVALKDKQNYIWSNDSDNDLIFTLNIKKATPCVPPLSKIYANAYDEFSLIALPNGFSWNKENGSNVGSLGDKIFFATYTPADSENYETITDIAINVVVTSVVRIPSIINSSLEYDGEEHELEFENLDNELVVLSGDTRKINIGKYSVTVSLKYPSLTMWSDGTKENKVFDWEITKIKIELIPKGNIVYNKTYDGNYYYLNSALTSLNYYNYPFDIIKKSTGEDISNLFTNENNGKFAIAENTQLKNNRLVLYANKQGTQTKKNIGESFALVNYALTDCEHYELSEENEQIVIFAVNIIKANLTFNSTLYSGNAKENQSLQEVEIISNSSVLAQISTGEDDINTELAPIAGIWSWREPQTILNESGEHFAYFTPNENAENFNNLEILVNVEISVEDGISAQIKVGANSAQEVTRKGNIFSFVSSAVTQKHTISVTLPQDCNATYAINNGETKEYSSENGIVLLQTLPENMIYLEEYEIKITLSGAIQKQITFFLTLKQSECEIKVNGKEWNGISGVKTGDKIQVNLLDTASANKIKINGIEQNEYIVTSKQDGIINIELLNGEQSILHYNLASTYLSPFDMIIIDKNQTNEKTQFVSYFNTIGFEHRLRKNQTTLSFEFTYQHIENVVIKYSLDSLNYTQLSADQIKLENLDISNTNTLYIDVSLNNVNILTISVSFLAFSVIDNIEYKKVDGYSYATNSPMVMLDSFLTDIVPILNTKDLTYELFDTNGNALNLSNLVLNQSLEFRYVLKIYDANKTNIIEEITYTVRFNFHFTISNTENNTLNQSGTVLDIIGTSASTFTIDLNYIPNHIILKFYDANGNPIDNNEFTMPTTKQTYTFEIANDVNNQKILGTINLLPTNNNINILDIFTSKTFKLDMPHSSYTKSINLEPNSINTLYLEANFDLADVLPYFISNLNALLVSNEYSLNISADEDSHMILVEILKNNQSFANLYFGAYILGEKNSNTEIEVEARVGMNNDNPQVTFNADANEYCISNIKSSSSFSISQKNLYAILKIYLADNVEIISEQNLILISTSSIYMDYEKNATYIIEVISTDKTKTEYYTLKINGIIQPFISITINEQTFETYLNGDDLTGTFELKKVNDEECFVATLNKDLLTNQNQIELTINTFDNITLLYANNQEIEKNVLTILQLTPQNQTTPTFVQFALQHNDDTIKCIIYFE